VASIVEAINTDQVPGLGARTMCEAFQLTAALHAGRSALRGPDGEWDISYAQLRDRMTRVAGGLHELGVRRGDTVGLMLLNRPEFHVTDLAAMHLGATPFSVYNTSSAEQIAYLLGDAANRVMICEAEFGERIEASGAQLDHLITIDELASLERDGFDVEPHWRAVEPEDVLTLIYTSGTTGPPKGVITTHANMLAEVRGLHAATPVTPMGRAVSFLPSAHIADRWASHYSALMVYGHTITDCPNAAELFAYVKAVRPTVFGAVPRVWEKLKAGLVATMGDAILEAAQRRDEQVAAAVRAQLGLDECERFITGAAPTPDDVMEFFEALGMPPCEVWGMSETSCVATINDPNAIRIGTVGRPLPGVELSLADDGELLVRGAIVMAGYRNRPDQTAEAIDPDGWLHTGDVATIDEEGLVRIVDRKKELIINSGGKNMSPANIEARLKSASPLIGQAICVGDRRPYNVALIVLDPEVAAGRAPDDPEVAAEIAEGVERANEQMSRIEQIKRYRVLEQEWMPGGDELTPTMKLRRKPIHAKYEAEIEALYA